MAVGVDNRTLAEVVKEVMRIAGLIVNEGTFTAGTTTTGTDATNERTPTAQANSLVGQYLYIWEGTGAGDYHEISSYSIGVFTWAVAGTAPTTTSKWVRVRINPQRVIDAVAEMTRAAWRKQAIPVMHTATVTNSLLEHFGDFEYGSTTPTGWALAGAGASALRETTNTDADGVPSGVYRTAITAGGGAAATLTFTVEAKYLSLIRGRTLYLQGHILEAVAADGAVRVSYTNSAGSSTDTDRTGTYAGNWEDLEDIANTGITMPDPVTNLSVQLRIVAGATVRLDDIMLLGPKIYDYALPSGTIGLEDVIYMEDGYRSKNYSMPLYYGSDWIVRRRESAPSETKYDNDAIHFKRSLPSGRHLRMATYVAPAVQTTATSNVDPNPVWLAHAAAEYILVGRKVQDEARIAQVRAWLNDPRNSHEVDTLRGHPYIPVEAR